MNPKAMGPNSAVDRFSLEQTEDWLVIEVAFRYPWDTRLGLVAREHNNLLPLSVETLRPLISVPVVFQRAIANNQIETLLGMLAGLEVG